MSLVFGPLERPQRAASAVLQFEALVSDNTRAAVPECAFTSSLDRLFRTDRGASIELGHRASLDENGSQASALSLDRLVDCVGLGLQLHHCGALGARLAMLEAGAFDVAASSLARGSCARLEKTPRRANRRPNHPSAAQRSVGVATGVAAIQRSPSAEQKNTERSTSAGQTGAFESRRRRRAELQNSKPSAHAMRPHSPPK
jgi:hypothetical protein